jgi:hypothetical protein
LRAGCGTREKLLSEDPNGQWKKPLEQKETKRPNRDCGARFKHGLLFAADGWIYWESSFLQSKINDEGEEAIES